MNCSYCGEYAPDIAVYCGYCGRQLPDTSLTPPRLSLRILGIFLAGLVLFAAGMLLVWGKAADPVTMMVRSATIPAMGSKHFSRVVETAMRAPRWLYTEESEKLYRVRIEGLAVQTETELVLGLDFLPEGRYLRISFVEEGGQRLELEEAIMFIQNLYTNAAFY